MRHGVKAALAAVLVIAGTIPASAQERAPVAWWSFDETTGDRVRDRAAGVDDAVGGLYRIVEGAVGRALELDGYTTVVTRPADRAPRLAGAFTIEVWVALAAYPWNWAPIVDQSSDDPRGYFFGIGPRGELGFNLASDGRWHTLTTPDYAVPLRAWTHVAASFESGEGLAIYVDGRRSAVLPLRGRTDYGGRPLTGRLEAARVDLIVGGVRTPMGASNSHRLGGRQPSWYSLDGLLDELKIHDVALAPSALEVASARPASAPAIAPRVFPSGSAGPGRFGAYYTKLEYHSTWDRLWRVGPNPDIVVRFDRSPVRVVFWRGTQYSPAWVTGNNLWMADQSVEGYDRDFTYEHMNDKQNRYSHVRIVEQSDARVVVHWRYALVSTTNELWNLTPRLENGAWIDEYYYLYPDAAGVRKVTWQRGTLGTPIQFQESILLAQPGQTQGEVVERDYATVGNLAGETGVLSYVANPTPQPNRQFPPHLTIQMHHFRSPHKPFIVFEPGNEMRYLLDRDERSLARPGSSNHWPVGQNRSDGRTSQALDRAGHFLGFPISSPPLHEGPGGRDYWNALYGMTDRPFADLVHLARSWATPPALTVQGGGWASDGYDRSERAYRLRRVAGAQGPLRIEIAASFQSPVDNLALVVVDWGAADARLRIDGREMPRGPEFRFGHRHRLEGSDLIVWLAVRRDRPMSIQVDPVR